MAEKSLKLILEIDSKSGEAAIKKLKGNLKGLETSSLGKALSKGTSVAAISMKELAKEAAKAAENYRKITDASKHDAERLAAMVKVEKQRLAAINRAHGEAQRIDDKRTAAIERQNRALKKQAGLVNRIKSQLFALRSYWLAISAAVAIATITVIKFFKAGFMSVEKFSLSVASVAASITTFSDLSKGNVAEVYAGAVKYAEQLALKMEIINVKTIATGEQLRAMNETFIQQGVLLDVNNQKQEDAFVSVANAISLITQGQNQEIQMRQEIRGLLSGDIRATNLLARMINTKLGGSLKKNIALWKQQGTLLENLGKHLEGFKAGSADLASTWAALSTTFDTIANRYLRGIFKPIYEDIIKSSLTFSRELLKQKDILGDTGRILKDELMMAWKSIKNTAVAAWNTVKIFAEPLLAALKIVNMIVYGWTEIARLVTDVSLTMKDKFLTKEGVMTWLEPFLKSIGYEGDFVLSTPLGEDEGAAETVKKPELMATKTKEQLTVEAAYWKKVNLLDREYQKERIKFDYEEFEERRKLQQLETDYLVADNKGALDIIEMIKKVHHVKMGQIDQDATKKRLEDEEDLREAARETAKEEIESREKVLKFISTERENKVRAIYQEADALKYLAKSTEELNKIASVATEKIQKLETEASDKRKKNHEKVLQFISTKTENELRAIQATHDALILKAETEEEIHAIRQRAAALMDEVYAKEMSTLDEWIGKATSSLESLKEVANHAAQSFSAGFASAFGDFVEGTKTANEAWKDFAKSFINQISRMITQMLILKAIQGIAGMFVGGAGASASTAGVTGGATTTGMSSAPMMMADGGVFNQGMQMQKFAAGGIVNSPTIFPMANGAGLMGEEGPEAIMPLKRGSSGKLGVEANTQSQPTNVNVTYNINAVDAISFAELTRRNPEAIAGPFISEVQNGNSGLRQAINVA